MTRPGVDGGTLVIEIVGGVDDKIYPNVPCDSDGMDVQTALERAWGLHADPHDKLHFEFVLSYYGDLGYFVQEIDHIVDTPASYWSFYSDINQTGQLEYMNIGIDTAMVTPGKTVRFAYEIYDGQRHAGTTLEVKRKRMLG